MTSSKVCSHCGTTLGPAARLCATCGTPASPAASILAPVPTMAGRGWRFVAGVFDLAILGASAFAVVRLTLRTWWFALLWVVYVEIGYHCGGSPGKFLIGLRVEGLSRRTHYFREIIGKLASTATFGVGFALVLAKDRLAMHDYMAGTKVCVRPLPFKRSQVLALLVIGSLIAPFGGIPGL